MSLGGAGSRKRDRECLIFLCAFPGPGRLPAQGGGQQRSTLPVAGTEPLGTRTWEGLGGERGRGSLLPWSGVLQGERRPE